MKLIPESRARWMIRMLSSWSLLPQSPNIMAPRQNLLTETPVRPSGRCSISCSLCQHQHSGWPVAASSSSPAWTWVSQESTARRPAEGLVDRGTGRAPHHGDSGRSIVVVDNRNKIRQFLASRRARITPEQAGLPAFGGNRRVAGLRQEELVLLAGVSVGYYTRLERGNLGGVSECVLDRLERLAPR